MSRHRSIMSWISAFATVPALALGAFGLAATTTQAAPTYTVTNTATGSFGGSEIVDIAVTTNGRYALVVGRQDTERKLRSINLVTRTKVEPSLSLATTFGTGTLSASSVAVHPSGQYAIVTMREQSNASTATGVAVFVAINQTTGELSPRAGVNKLDLGVNPESVAIAPNGKYAVVVNEGNTTVAGSIQIIDLRTATPSIARTIDPDNNAGSGALPQPEEVTISPSSSSIFATIQENSDIQAITINPDTLVVANNKTIDLSGSGRNPDGLAALDDRYVVVANEGNSTAELLSYDAAAQTLTSVNTVPVPAAEMVAIGTVGGGGVNRAFVTSPTSDSVYVFRIASTGITQESVIPLNASSQPPADRPEGIALVNAFNVVVTANVGSTNISIIQATPEQQPTPTYRVYLPLVLK